MAKKKKLSLLFIGVVIIIALISYLIQPSTAITHKECELNSCDCKCYIKGQILEHSTEVTSCERECEELFNIIGCKHVGLECPYGITACAVVDAINEVFVSEQCEIVKGE